MRTRRARPRSPRACSSRRRSGRRSRPARRAARAIRPPRSSTEHLGRLGDAAEPDQRPRLASHCIALRSPRRPGWKRPAQRAEDLERLRVAVARRAAPARPRAMRSIRSRSGVADPGLEQHPLDREPLRQPAEQLVRGHDLAALDLAHVLLREPAGGESSWVMPAARRSSRTRVPSAVVMPCRVSPTHHDPTAIPRSPNCLPSMDHSVVPAALGSGKREHAAARDRSLLARRFRRRTARGSPGRPRRE